MKKIIFTVVAILLVTSCAKTAEKTPEQRKKIIPSVSSSGKALEKTKNETGEEAIEAQKTPEVPKNRILLNAQTENLPDLSALLDTTHPLKPEIVNLPTDVIWERGGKLEDVVMVDDSPFIITDNSTYKGKAYDIESLDDIGATTISHGTHKGLIGNINYENYISFDKGRVACTSNTKTEVFDSKTDELIFKYGSRELERPSDNFVCCSKLSGDELFIGNPYEIICFDMTNLKEKYRISFESLGKEDYLKSDSIRFVSFIGKINDSMYVFTKGSKIAIYKVTPDGKATILYSTSEVGESSYDDPLYLIGKSNEYTACTNNESITIILDAKKNDVYEIDGATYAKYTTENNRFLVIADFIFDLETHKPIIKIPNNMNHIYDVKLFDNYLLAKVENVLYSVDLRTLKTAWSLKLDWALQFLPNYKSNQASIRVDYTNILYFFPDNPTKMWKLDLKKVNVAQYRDDEKTSNHISTALVGISDVKKTWFDHNENKVYISDWTSFCLGDNTNINPLVFPTKSDWCFDQGQSAVIQPVSMDIFVRWNGANAVKTFVQCNSKEKSNLKSEIMLEPGKLTRLKVWFNNKGQVLTIGDKSYNIYINPGWCPD